LRDYEDFEKALADGSLPPVVFYKPIGGLNQHPGYTDIMSGDKHIADVIAKVEQSPMWKDTLVIVTYDEHGGYWDHVPPPKIDEWGPGLRVPALFIGPMVKKGFIDHTTYETTSILTFIEKKYGLEPLTNRDRDAPNLTNFFE
jgi:acid phosphatase